MLGRSGAKIAGGMIHGKATVHNRLFYFNPLYANPYPDTMTDCKFCEKPMGENPYIEDEHDVCNDQYWKRRMAELCIHCGKNPILEDMFCCRDCKPDDRYQGYIGPA